MVAKVEVRAMMMEIFEIRDGLKKRDGGTSAVRSRNGTRVEESYS